MLTTAENVSLTNSRYANWDDVRELSRVEGACITIYLGPYLRGSGSGSTKEKLRSLLPVLKQVLKEKGIHETDRDALLAPIVDLNQTFVLEEGHADSVVIFRSIHVFQMFRIAVKTEDSHAVEGRFQLRPLLESLHASRPFYILALARKHIRLFDCGAEGCPEVALPSTVPQDLETFGDFDQPDHELINHSSSGPSTGRANAVKFGTGSSEERSYVHMHDFHKSIDRGIHTLLADRQIPLVLAGTEADVASYRKVTTYKLLCAEAICLSPDGGFTGNSLAEKGRKILAEWLRPEEQHALLFYERAGTKRIQGDAASIVSMAARGRVLHLFITTAPVQRGNVDRLIGRNLLSGEFISDDDDLLNAAITEVLRHSGHVWFLPPEKMPERAVIAAAFRF